MRSCSYWDQFPDGAYTGKITCHVQSHQVIELLSQPCLCRQQILCLFHFSGILPHGAESLAALSHVVLGINRKLSGHQAWWTGLPVQSWAWCLRVGLGKNEKRLSPNPEVLDVSGRPTHADADEAPSPAQWGMQAPGRGPSHFITSVFITGKSAAELPPLHISSQ